MYVCICHGVSEADIRRAAHAGCRDLHELTMRTGCGASCGSCRELAEITLAQSQPCALQRSPLELPGPGRRIAAS